MHVYPKPTYWHSYFCHLTHFVIWPFFYLWPLNRRSGEKVTVDTNARLPNTNTLTLLLFLFDTFCNLTFLWPLTPYPSVGQKGHRGHFACLPNTNTLALLLLSFDTFCNLTSVFDPCDPKWPLLDLWLITFVESPKLFIMPKLRDPANYYRWVETFFVKMTFLTPVTPTWPLKSNFCNFCSH